MRRLALIALLALAHGLGAFGGTSESWLGGTQPWDSVPKKELNLGLQGHGGDGRAGLGALAEWGIFDQLMLAGTWDQPVDGSAGSGDALLKLREAEFPTWRPAMALYVRSGFGSRQAEAVPGLVLAIEPWDHSLEANLEYSGTDGLGLRLGYWTPYLISFFRAGFEGYVLSASGSWHLLPQITFQAPGDLSAVLGAETATDASGQWSWRARISYQLFPSP
jgi:hypothetical protein